MYTHNKFQGKKGEEQAKQYLLDKGYKFVCRNFRTKFGEIDLIFIDKNFLVFVEVKKRVRARFGLPEEAVTYKKLQKITLSAEIFCRQHKNIPSKYRIEIISILGEDGISHYIVD